MTPHLVHTVVKIGGSLVSHVGHLDAALSAVAVAAKDRRILIVPGGGPFADAVRDVDRRLGLSDDAAHWMAVLGMDQFAHVLAGRLRGGFLVEDRSAIVAAAGAPDAGGKIPILAPYRWLRQADPLRHTWDVTSDSIAAWVAGQVGAARVVLIKSPSAAGPALVDVQFTRVLPPQVEPAIVPADQIDALRSALAG